VKLPAIDKQAHFYSGWALSATLFPYMGWPVVLAVAALGYAKERWDRQGHGTYDLKDLYATALGGLVGCILHTIMQVGS